MDLSPPGVGESQLAFLKCAARPVLTVCVGVEVSYRVTIVVIYNTCIHICTHIDAYVHTYSCEDLYMAMLRAV